MLYKNKSRCINLASIAVVSSFILASSMAYSGGGAVCPVSSPSPLMSPSYSLLVPTGYVGSWGQVGLSVSGITKVHSGNNDAAAAVGVGVGDPYQSIGGTAILTMGSINAFDDNDKGIFERNHLSFNVGHVFQGGIGAETAVAVGAHHVVALSDSKTSNRNKVSFYAAATQVFDTKLPIALTLGMGNRMYSNKYSVGFKQSSSQWGVFGSAAVVLMPQMSVVAEYLSRATTVGVSLVPIKSIPIKFDVGVWDIFHKVYGHSKDVSIAASVSVAFNLK